MIKEEILKIKYFNCLKILKDIKKNKNKAVIKYEKNLVKIIKLNHLKKEINKAIKSLNPKIKKAIDFAYNRIFKYHSLQKPKNINYKDKYNNKIEYKSVPIK